MKAELLNYGVDHTPHCRPRVRRAVTQTHRVILYNCVITSIGAKDLSIALAQNSSLEKLDISSNNLRDLGISHVAETPKKTSN